MQVVVMASVRHMYDGQLRPSSFAGPVLQGELCIYLHKELPASSGVCRAYAAGFCPKGQACTQKHLTPKMLRELRASRTLRAGNAKVRAE